MAAEEMPIESAGRAGAWGPIELAPRVLVDVFGLGTSPATALVLPGVIAAVASRVPVPVDGGVRRVPTWRRPWGRTPCWSADRYAWGLATFAAPGVARVIEILRTELEMAMGLLGTPRMGTPRLGAHRLDALRPDALWP